MAISLRDSDVYKRQELDPAKNIQHIREDLCISKDGSKTEVWVIPTNEELAIARDTLELISK